MGNAPIGKLGKHLMNKRYSAYNGFTLIEMTVVLLLITLLASVAVRETAELGFQTRYEQTKERLEMIRQAILGNPKLIINGQLAVSGFVADMGRLPLNIRELVDQTYCAVDRTIDETTSATAASDCNALVANKWIVQPNWQADPLTGLMSGWHGPYLSVSGNVTDVDLLTDGWGRGTQGYCSTSFNTNQTSCPDAGSADWVQAALDHNYGWYFNQLAANSLSILSYGKNQMLGGADNYDLEYPITQPVIKSQDWRFDITNGISVTFLKLNKLLPISFCSDPSKTAKTACASPEIWHGGCSLAGYYNKSSCEAATPTAGTWISPSCSDGTSTTKTACETAGKIWYGEGFGCSDQSKTNKIDCTSPAIWRSCTDNGTITNQSACSSANQTWFGDNIFSISINTTATQTTANTIPVCMKIFYRTANATIGSLVSDENIGTAVNNEPKLIYADGSTQTIRFVNFRDADSGNLQNDVPIGNNAIAVYQYDGADCKTSNVFYPINHQMPIQVDFHPYTNLPVINW